MIYKSLLITSLIISSSFSLGFEELATSNKDNLTLEKAVELSLRNDPWLLGNQYSQNAIENKSISVGTYADPKITISAGNLPTDTFNTKQEAMTQLNIGVSQIFPRGDSLEIKQEQLSLQASQFPFQREDRKAKTVMQVTQLWLEAFKAQESIALIEKDYSLFSQLADIAESSYASTRGKTKQQDIIRAQLELTRLDDRLTRLKQQKDMYLSKLSEWIYDFSNDKQLNKNLLESLNLKLPNTLPSISLFSKKFKEKKDDQAVLEEFSNHPVIKSIEQKIKAISKDINLAREEYKPQFGLNASYGLRDKDLKGNSRSDLFSLGVSFDIPIFTKNKQDRDLQAAILKTKSVRTEKLLELRKLYTSYLATKANFERLQEREKLYDGKLLSEMNDQAEASLTSYTNDVGDFSEVVRSRISELNAKIDALNIHVEIQKNYYSNELFFYS
jgi:outer membrane protein TolC